MRPALLFDLDDTLVVEDRAATAAFAATTRHGLSQRAIEAEPLALAAREHARELWRATPVHPYCLRVSISSSEGLWCRFEGDGPETTWLRQWSPAYRRETWRRALAQQGVDDIALADELGERFGTERRARHETFADAAPALSELGTEHTLALLTNGASCLQREKLAASGLADRFAAVIVSAEVGVGKPDGAIFRHALAQLGADAGHAVMIGDSRDRDIDAALAAGLGAVWIDRSAGPTDPAITTLRDLRATLAGVASRHALLPHPPP